MIDFAHLHLHSEYSLLDGACKIGQLMQRVADLGQKSVAITDHGVMYGVIDFYKAAKKHEIKPIIGCEVYVANRGRFDKTHPLDSSPFHLVLLCKDNSGYQNLIKLVSLGFTEGFYHKPRIDKDLLRKYSGGLIALSACLGGELPRLIEAGDHAKAKQTALEYNEIMGEGNFYLELQNHGIPQQKKANSALARISKETGIPLVATNDCHYLAKTDAEMQKVLMSIAMNKTIYDDSGGFFATPEFYVKSGEEMAAALPEYAEALENTVKIADRCEVEFEFGVMKLPEFGFPQGREKREFFEEKCRLGLKKFYGEAPEKAIVDRLEYEIDVITSMGFIDYFLIVADFIEYARSKDIPVGPGRGSGAGSLCAYVLQITKVDPIEYGLIFERFLNPERISMPDFDIDFCYERRGEVIDYVINKYGADHVAQIVTFGTLAPRAAVRDVGRAMDIPYKTVDQIATAIPQYMGLSLAEAKDLSSDLRKLLASDEKSAALYEMAGRVEGLPRHTSTHAAGVVITKEPVDSILPLAKNDESVITQFPMGTLEELGLLKMDFLGLRNLTVLSDAERTIRLSEPDFLVDNIPLDDSGVFDMLSRADSIGVFQFESTGLRRVMEALKPRKFEDLIALTSLYRPGPMDSIPTYVKNRHSPENIKYHHPMLEPILKETYGCIVYQEQVMEIFRTLAGYSYGGADLVRRAMSKKKSDIMLKERESFIGGRAATADKPAIDGAVKRGVSAKAAGLIFDEMASFASYAFNKSHAAAYAMIAYQTAYLKLNYPTEFFAALISSVIEFTTSMVTYIKEAKKHGINVSPPNINESFLKFTKSENGIEFGLLGIKNLGKGLIYDIIAEREIGGLFSSLPDFCARMAGKGMSKKALEQLIFAGAFDSFGRSRRSMVSAIESLQKAADLSQRIKLSGQISMFDGGQEGEAATDVIPNLEEYPYMELLAFEKGSMGFYISGHPTKDVRAELEGYEIDSVLDIHNESDGKYKNGKEVLNLVIIEKFRKKITKKKQTMAFLTVSDEDSEISVIVFPGKYEALSPLIREGEILLLRSRVSAEEDEELNLILENVYTLAEAKSVLRKKVGGKNPAKKERALYINLPFEGCAEFKLALDILAAHGGNMPVFLNFAKEKKLVKAPKKYWISEEKAPESKLAELLGESNVIFR